MKDLFTAWAIEIEVLVVFILPLCLIAKGIADLKDDRRRR